MEAIMNIKEHHTSEQLLSLYKSEPNSKLARRIQGVYLAHNGHSCPEIIQITGACRRAVQQWIQKYNRGGIEALKDKPRPGKPTTLPRRMERKFCRRIESGPSQQDGVSVLNGQSIKLILEREFGVVYSLWGVYDLLHRLGYSCLCPRPQHEQADPQAQEVFKKTCQKNWIKSDQSIQRVK
jgi:putative transposase